MSHGPRWRADIIDLANLAWPVIINRLGIMMLGVVDTIMVGRYAAEHLAYFGLGLVISNIIILIKVGLLIGVQVLVSQYFGAHKYASCGQVWWRSLPYAAGLGFIGFVICAFAEPILIFFGQDADLAREAGRVSFINGLSLPILAVYMATSMFLEGIRRVRPAMMIVLCANIINIFANYALVYGEFGMPELGATGSVWASLLVRSLQLLTILSYVWFMYDHARYDVRRPPKRNVADGKEMRQIGYMAGISMGIENLSFNALTVFAGLLGALALASHVITINVFGLGVMAGLGFGAATSVRVGNAHGAGHNDAAMRAGWLGLGVQTAAMIIITIISVGYAHEIASFYSKDAEVIALASVMIQYMSLILIMDTAQMLLAQAVRTRGDGMTPMIIYVICYGGVMLPLTYIMAFRMNRGVFGLIDATLIATLLSMTLVGITFYRTRYIYRNLKPREV